MRQVKAASFKGILGINIGKNKDTAAERALDDYLYCLDKVYDLSSYVTINISSPNTRDCVPCKWGDSFAAIVGWSEPCAFRFTGALCSWC